MCAAVIMQYAVGMGVIFHVFGVVVFVKVDPYKGL